MEVDFFVDNCYEAGRRISMFWETSASFDFCKRGLFLRGLNKLLMICASLPQSAALLSSQQLLLAFAFQ